MRPPQAGQWRVPAFTIRRRRWSARSVSVPTVEREFLTARRWRSAIAGSSPSAASSAGLGNLSMNCRR